jgi:hypothetical protein
VVQSLCFLVVFYVVCEWVRVRVRGFLFQVRGGKQNQSKGIKFLCTGHSFANTLDLLFVLY